MVQPVDFRNQYGPWAIIAGATDGTGEVYAQRLAEKGLNLVLVARRQNLLEVQSADLASAYGIKTLTLAIDLTDSDAAEKMLDAVSQLEIGLFIANAGAGGGGIPFLRAGLDDWHKLMNINVNMPLAMCHGLAGAMLERGRGGLLLMGSGVALGGQPRTSVYCASKGFSLNLAESLWAEFKPRGVDVLNVVAPLINTPTLRRGFGKKEVDPNMPGLFEPEEVVDTALAQLPIGPCYVFPAGPEIETAAAITKQRRGRLEQVTEITKLIFGDLD